MLLPSMCSSKRKAGPARNVYTIMESGTPRFCARQGGAHAISLTRSQLAPAVSNNLLGADSNPHQAPHHQMFLRRSRNDYGQKQQVIINQRAKRPTAGPLRSVETPYILLPLLETIRPFVRPPPPFCLLFWSRIATLKSRARLGS